MKTKPFTLDCCVQFLVLPFLLLSFITSAQDCPPGNILFESQNQIDQFIIDYPNCSEINGSLTIEGIQFNSINNLAPLIQIKSVADLLFISNNFSLTDFSGLDSLSYAKRIVLLQCNGLTSLEGLGKFSSIETFSIQSCSSLTNFRGLEHLTEVTESLILSSSGMTDFQGLENLKNVGEDFSISSNQNLTSLNGLSGLENMDGILYFFNNNSLEHLIGLENIKSLGSLNLIENANLSDLTALYGLTAIDSAIVLINNPVVTSLEGLNNVNPVPMTFLYLYGNPNLSFCGVESICKYLKIPNNAWLISDNSTGCNFGNEIAVSCPPSSTTAPLNYKTLNIFPNPANNLIIFDGIQFGRIQIKDISGAMISEINISSGQADISFLPSGIYILSIVSKSDFSVGKFIKI